MADKWIKIRLKIGSLEESMKNNFIYFFSQKKKQGQKWIRSEINVTNPTIKWQ